MADTAIQVLVSPILRTVIENLTSMIQSEFSLIMGFNKDMKKLSNILSTIQDVLEDAEVKQITDKPVRNWLRKLKKTTYDAEDVLDECATEALRTTQDNERENCNINQVITHSITHSILSSFDFKRIMFRRSIGKKIKQLREKFDEIAEERLKFHLNLNVITIKDSESKRETSSFIVDSSQVYGRDKEKEYMVNLLLNNNDDDGVKICPILGMGGLGKTTLAQMVHNDERIVHHFQVRCWVCVSEQFELKTLLKAIIESLGGKAPDLKNLDPLQRRLEELLSGKKFLLILDDVWNEDQAKWDKLKSSLNFGGRGSSVIVTTRLETVASIMNSSTLPMCCRLEGLSEENCWSLFKSRAFGAGGNEEEHQNKLEGIGREIVKRCKGVPLAAKALGGLLRFKREEKEWLYVRDNEIWDLPQDTEGDAILPALRLSYNHLPSHLKQCFSYCSIFPKDYEMQKQELIQLWMANGFVPQKRNMELEDMGNEIFNDLVWRSFFQDVKKDENGNVTECKMHDLVHDLACSIMAHECCSINEDDTTKNFPTSVTKHLSLIYLGYSTSSSTILDKSFLPTSKSLLHTLLQIQLYHPQPKTPVPQLPVSNLKYLRVLGFHWTNMTRLPKSIGNLKHLRYLDLSCSEIKSVPAFICNLRKLQTLKLHGCHKLQKLSKNMRKMSNLRHLDIRWCSKLTGMPVGIGKLISLQTLTRFIVSPKRGCGSIKELQGLDHLRGELTIEGLEHVRNPTDAETANLTIKQNLTSLRLVWSRDSVFRENSKSTELSEQENEAAMVLIESLQPHPNIKELHIKIFRGVKFPRWMWSFSCLPNLTRISLVGCWRCDHLPPLGQLPLLKFLKITGMDSVKYIADEFYYGEEGNAVRREGSLQSFQSLEELHFSRMPNLKEWRSWSSTSSKGEKEREEKQVLAFPCLNRLSIEFCPMLRACPPLPFTLHHLKLIGCNEMILVNSLEKLTSLQHTGIGYCTVLKSLPKISSTSLRNLSIQFCDGLTSLSEGLQYLTSLDTLSIQSCPLLELSEHDFLHLIALQNLSIVNLPKMTSLPIVGSEHKTSKLGNLQLSKCSGLTTLPGWICHLTSLQSMTITHCENLTLLPEGMQNLTSLQTATLTCIKDAKRRWEMTGTKLLTFHSSVIKDFYSDSLPVSLGLVAAGPFTSKLKIRCISCCCNTTNLFPLSWVSRCNCRSSSTLLMQCLFSYIYKACNNQCSFCAFTKLTLAIRSQDLNLLF